MNFAMRARDASNAAVARLLNSWMPRWTLALSLLVIMAQRVQHRARFLAAGRVVEINQRMAVDLLVEDGKVQRAISPNQLGFFGALRWRFQ